MMIVLYFMMTRAFKNSISNFQNTVKPVKGESLEIGKNPF